MLEERNCSIDSLAGELNIHPNSIRRWKKDYLSGSLTTLGLS
ncbi:transposase [Chryseobacterium phocaeense]